MTAPAPIRKSDLSRAAQVASDSGCVVEIKIGATTYTIRPDSAKTVGAVKEIRL